MQGQLRDELQRLGDKEIALLSKEFEDEWIDIYKGIHLPSDSAFSTISVANAKQMVNMAWLSDGKTFSQRVWSNIERLTETLNEELIHCIITGKKPTELKQLLMDRFNVSFRQADMLVRTEVTHIATQAAAQRYQDYGLKYYEFLGRYEHDIGCKCKKLNGEKFLYSEMQVGKNAPPLHPNCRCAIIPVIDDDEIIKD
jgi:SPP1 gp7 family putative phage head morphogenesis protein